MPDQPATPGPAHAGAAPGSHASGWAAGRLTGLAGVALEPPDRPLLEIVVQDVSGAVAAVRAGAERLELCSALTATGGVTPGTGLLERVVAAVPEVGVHVLVRPRPGGFVYTSDEVEVMVAEIHAAARAGAAGVVVGALTEDGRVDARVLGLLVEAAGDLEVTFHRAFDSLAPAAGAATAPAAPTVQRHVEPLNGARRPAGPRRSAAIDAPMLAAALDALAEHRVTRVLTSGGAPRVGQGLARIRTTVELARGRVQVMAGGGVRVAEIGRIAATGVDAVHLSASRTITGDGGPGGGGVDSSWSATDPYLVAAARAALT